MIILGDSQSSKCDYFRGFGVIKVNKQEFRDKQGDKKGRINSVR